MQRDRPESAYSEVAREEAASEDGVSISNEWDVLKRLGPLDGAIADPIVPCPVHPFALVEGNHFCGMCGGGILNPIHERNVSVQEKRP
jgi:hypothetical protein